MNIFRCNGEMSIICMCVYLRVYYAGTLILIATIPDPSILTFNMYLQIKTGKK